MWDVVIDLVAGDKWLHGFAWSTKLHGRYAVSRRLAVLWLSLMCVLYIWKIWSCWLYSVRRKCSKTWLTVLRNSKLEQLSRSRSVADILHRNGSWRRNCVGKIIADGSRLTLNEISRLIYERASSVICSSFCSGQYRRAWSCRLPVTDPHTAKK